MDKLAAVLSMLASGDPLPKQYRNHQLLSAMATGSHADLFGK